MCPGYLAEATCPGDGLKVVINLTQEAEQALAMVPFYLFTNDQFLPPNVICLLLVLVSVFSMTLQVSELAVSYHQQRVELGLSVPITKEQQIDVARQDFAAFLLRVAKNIPSAGMTSASLSASSTDR